MKMAGRSRLRRIRNCLLYLILTIPALVISQDSFNKVGTVSALFLKMPIGGMAVSTGAATTLYDGALGVFANPATVALTPNRNLIGFSYTQWLMGIHHQAVAYSRPLGRDSYVGLNLISLVSSEMEVTTTHQQNGTGEFFRFQDLAAGISGARRFSDRLTMGLTAKVIFESAFGVNALGYAVDFGTWYWVGARDMCLTMTLRNFGPEIHYNGTYQDTHVKGNLRRTVEYDYGSYPLPLTFSLGMAGNVVEGEDTELKLHLEAQHLNDYTPRVNTGLRWVSAGNFWLAAGLKLNYEQESFSAGFGFDGNRFAFGYGYQPMRHFAAVHTISLAMKM